MKVDRINGFILKILTVLFFCVTALSCGDNTSPHNEAIQIDIDNIISNEPLVFSDVFSGFHIIRLETHEDCVINQINNIKIIRDTIYIFDKNAKSVFIFSNKGKSINKISRIGRGPGEFIQPSDFDVKGNAVLIFDYSTKKLCAYDKKGNFIYDLNLKDRFSSFITTDDNVFAYKPFPAGDTGTKDDYLLNQYNNSGKIIWKAVKYSDFLHGIKVIQSLDGGNFFMTENDIKFYMNYCTTIFSINNQSVKPYIVLNSEKHKLTKEDMKNYKMDEPMTLFSANPDKLSKISGYSENDSMAFLKFQIGISEYYTFIHFRTRKILCCSRYNDDLTYIYPNLFQINNNQLIAYVHPRRVSAFRELVATGKVKIDDNLKDELLEASDFDNPVLILYDLREK
ncbi:MAG TPA: 6-bladed beta-propeller [Bacteroidales bacterium]|nr:6-bladed beta-propeller [Bacteroidales bacterium]